MRKMLAYFELITNCIKDIAGSYKNCEIFFRCHKCMVPKHFLKKKKKERKKKTPKGNILEFFLLDTLKTTF